MTEEATQGFMPTMRLRWYQRRNSVTAADVSAYRETRPIGLMQAKAELTKATEPVLQQWFQDPADKDAGEWREVQLFVESHCWADQKTVLGKG